MMMVVLTKVDVCQCAANNKVILNNEDILFTVFTLSSRSSQINMSRQLNICKGMCTSSVTINV